MGSKLINRESKYFCVYSEQSGRKQNIRFESDFSHSFIAFF